MENPLHNIEQHLKDLSKKYCFQFLNVSDNKKLKKDYATPYNSSLVWTYEDVIKKYGSVIDLFTHMQKNLNAEGVTIAFRKPNGDRSIATSKKHLTISFKNTSKSMENTTQQTPHTQQTPATPLAGPVGLGFAQIIDYEKKANRLEILEESYNKQKKQIEVLETLNNKLQRELDDANSKCKLAEDRKNFEVEKARSEKRSFFTPELVKELAPLAGAFIGAVGGGSSPTQNNEAGLGNPYANLTKDQQTLIDEIAQGNLTENQQFIMYQVIEGLKANPNFEMQLTSIINNQ